MSKTMKIFTLIPLLFMLAPVAQAKLQVFACEPEWQALATELAGERVVVYTATTAFQDPHHIQARPGLIAKLRQADLLICTGSELEIGWLPLLLRQAGNPRVQPGQPGHFMATEHVTLLDIPNHVDRSGGDMHAGGNPHIQTDPRNMAAVASALRQTLQQLDGKHSAEYENRYQAFAQRWQSAISRWQQMAAPLRGLKVVVHHRSWIYLFEWLGIEDVASLEPKPGVPPSAGHLADILTQLRQQPAALVVRAAFQEERPSRWLAEHAHIPAVTLPFTVGGSPVAKDLTGLYDDTIAQLLKGVQP